MKYYLAILSLLVFTSASHANDAHKKCSSYSEYAEIIMTQRQSGTPMPEMIELVNGDGKIFEDLVFSAYEIPRYDTKKMQNNTIKDFRDNVYLNCRKGFKALK